MAQFTPDNVTNLTGRCIDGALNIYEQLLNDGHQPGDPELHDLFFLRDRINNLIAQATGQERVPTTFVPRWKTE